MARIYLTNLDSDVSGYKLAMVNQRSPITTALTASITGTTASGTRIQCTDTSGGSNIAWITKPFLADVALSATPMFLNIWGGESNAAANANVYVELQEYASGAEGAQGGIAGHAPNAELTTTTATRNAYVTTALTATTIDAGNRLVIKLFVANTGTMAPGYAVTIDYDGPTEGADGDTFIEVNESIRTNERQMRTGSYPTATQLSPAFYQQIIDGLNAVNDAQVIDITAFQSVLDDLGYERDNL